MNIEVVQELKIDVVQEFLFQRGFKEVKNRKGVLVGVRQSGHVPEYLYIKIFETKFELNTTREFVWSNFTINPDSQILEKTSKNVVCQLVIVCLSFQNSHVKEFREASKNIQIIRSDFFHVNITKIVPHHEKVLGNGSGPVISKKGLPAIKEDDPVCTFYFFKKGDLIRVIRKNGEICYRVVK